jgi:hypothetical protein
MGERRKRTRHIATLEQRLLKATEDLRAKGKALEPGKEQEAIFAKARQFEAQVSMNELFVPPPNMPRPN